MASICVDDDHDEFFSCDEIAGSSVSEDHGKCVQDNEQLYGDGDEDSDMDVDISRTNGPRTNLEKRRAQNELMRGFAANISSILTQREADQVISKSANEEQLSVRDILAKQETTVRITNPRDYQTELFQRAKSENIIAVLDTGSGKTHIATLLLRHILEEELDHRARGSVHKIAFFLVRFICVFYSLLISSRSIRLTSSFNKQTYFDVVWTRKSRVFAVPWALPCGRSQLGRNTLPITWS